MRRLKRLGIVLLVVMFVVFALVGVLTLTRGTPVSLVVSEGDERGPPVVGDSLFERSVELYTGTHMQAGNIVQQVNNGTVYDSLLRDLRSAKRTITMQMYYSKPGAVADSVGSALRERAAAGVRVLLLLDAFGSQNLTRAWADSLRDAGVEVAVLRKLRWYTIHDAVDRSHARVVVVDGRIGYTGGFGLADYWLGTGRREGEWRESNVRFQGPAVMALQAAFMAAWAEATSELLAGDTFFPRATFTQEPGTVHAGILFTAPTKGSTPAERFLALTITGARRTLYITNSYFVPDDDFRAMLKRAVKRGVDVRILTVGRQTDVKTTWYAGRAHYEDLLEGGVRIWEYQPTMIHSKTIVADGLWATVGSMNFDNRSIAFNNETNLAVLDSAFGREMDATFLEDLRYSQEIRLAEFRQRSALRKLLEKGASLFTRLL
jgi:cardiolipin synthase A/B